VKKFWNWIKNEEDARTLYLEGVIAEESWLDDDITPAAFKAELMAGTGPVTIWLNSPGGDVFAELKKTFETVAMAKVSTSAVEAKELGLLRAGDKVAFNAYELLYIAKQEARALAETGYRPPLPARRIQVAGDVGIATFRMLLVNMLEGRFISPYDDEIATRIATVLCGGEVDRGATVDEEWLLRLERKHFVELAQQEKTQARIAHMLKTGKPLRN